MRFIDILCGGASLGALLCSGTAFAQATAPQAQVEPVSEIAASDAHGRLRGTA